MLKINCVLSINELIWNFTLLIFLSINYSFNPENYACVYNEILNNQFNSEVNLIFNYNSFEFLSSNLSCSILKILSSFFFHRQIHAI